MSPSDPGALAGSKTPAAAMTRLLARPLPLAPWVLRDGSQLTRPWTREGFDDHVPPMIGHLVATYHGEAQSCAWKVENRRLTASLRPGTITLVPEAHDGEWRLDGRATVSHVYLTSGRIEECAVDAYGSSRVELLDRLGATDPTAARIMSLLADEAAVDDSAASLFVERATDLLCLQLLRAHSSLGGVPARRPMRGLARWQVNRITSYMREHLASTIRLTELAALVGLSRYHFCSAFRLATGTTPHEALTRLRIARARRLLASSRLRVTDIALAVGYQTSSAFAASFRKVVGVTPTHYRAGL